MFFDITQPYFDMYTTKHPPIPRGKPTVLHRKTCPVCDKKLTNLYYSNQADKYVCKNCIDKAMKEKE